MKVTDCLMAEHQVLLRQMEHLHQNLGQPEISPELLRAALKLFESGLAGHAALEEEHLYPALEPHLGRDSGPLAVMDAEHNDIRATLGLMAEGEDPSEIRALLGHLLEVLYSHFSKEESVLFPMAESYLSSAELEDLGEKSTAGDRPPPF